jgi:hypothetical protein
MARESLPHVAPHTARLHATLETIHRALEVLGIVLLVTVYASEVFDASVALRILEGLHRGLEVAGILILCAVVSMHHRPEGTGHSK